MTKSLRSAVAPAFRKIIWCAAIVCGLYATAMTRAEASESCVAVNTGAFSFSNPAFDVGNSAILIHWSPGDQITVTFTDAVGFSHADGLFHGPTLAAIGSLQTVTVPSGGSASFTYTVVPGDLTNGILVDPENNDQVTATCVAVNTTSTTTAMIASPNPSVFGQPVSLTANVSGSGGTPTGSVTFMDGAAIIGSGTLAGGTASTAVSSLSVGSHNLTAVYSGDASFATSTSPIVTEKVNKGTTTTIVTGSPNPSAPAQLVTFTATVAPVAPAAGIPSGTVTFNDGGSPLGSVTLSNKSASLTTSALSPGIHAITAVYNGDGNFVGSTSSTLSQFVGSLRTWVSAVGADTGACSRDVPCLTFSYALSVTRSSGEIDCLDQGGFGGLTIDKSISIVCGYGEAGVLVSGTDGIVVNIAATDQVVLNGLDIEGLGSGLDGVKILSAGTVYVIKCSIHHFTGNGVNMTSSSPGAHVFIVDSIINLNGGGVNVQGSGAGNVAGITNTVIDGNTGFAVQVSGAGNIVGVANSILINSPTGISLVSGGAALSFGPANIVGGAGAFTSAHPLQ
ncbi:MAG TPA: Ig-like domain repeat protein [Pseudolabrys sp.]|jgi:hypothetical protein